MYWQKDEKWLTMYVLALYKCTNAEEPSYRTKLMNGIIKSEGGPENLGLIQALPKNKYWGPTF